MQTTVIFRSSSSPMPGNGLSMLVLLAKKTDGLPDLEKRLTPENLIKWTKGLSRQEVEVFLPRFRVTSRFDLGRALSSMGMVDAFDRRKADFSGMDGKPGWLYIGVVAHKAFVDVNEEGTEAAAATGVGVTYGGSARPDTRLPRRPRVLLPDPSQPHREHPLHGAGS